MSARHRPAIATVALAALVTVVGSVLVAAGVALAHAELVSTSPANQAVLEETPPEIVLRFSEGVDPIEPAIRLVDDAGGAVDTSSVDQSGGSDTMRVEIPDALAAGTYVVAWQAVSADSHRIRGAFTFSVGEASTTAPGLVDELFDAEPDGSADALLLGIGRFLSYAGTGVLVGLAVMTSLLAPDRAATRRFALVTTTALGVAIVGTMWMLAAQAHLITGSYWSWGDVADTQSGRWWFARLIALPMFGAVVAIGTRLAPIVRAAVWQVAAVAVLAIVAAGGHGITGDAVAMGFAATLVHLGAMVVWIGGLSMVAVASRGTGWDTAARVSPWAFGAVVVLAVSGTVNGWRQVGTLSGLTESTYGRWLVVKLALVVVVVVLAIVSRIVLRRGPEEGRLVRRAVIVELAAMALVLMATAGLVNSAPPEDGPQLESASAIVGERIAQVELDPSVTGGTEMHVYLTSPGGGLDRADEITVTAALPAADLGPLDIDTVPAGPNHVIGSDVVLPIAGTWRFEITARYGEFDQVVFDVDIPVSD